MDVVDSYFLINYFGLVIIMYMIYIEIVIIIFYLVFIIFDCNVYNVLVIVCVVDVLWFVVGMFGLYKGLIVVFFILVYLVLFELVDCVGGWDCDVEVIGEDLYMYFKCFFVFNGNLIVWIVMSFVSQINVIGGGYGKGIFGLIVDVQVWYK